MGTKKKNKQTSQWRKAGNSKYILEACCFQSSGTKHINGKFSGRKNCGKKWYIVFIIPHAALIMHFLTLRH